MSKKKQPKNNQNAEAIVENHPTESKSAIITNIIVIIILSILGVLFYSNYHKNQIGHYRLINHSLVKEGNGLYADTLETGLDPEQPFTSKYYYRGKNVNNFLLFENKCFRIINIAQNNTLKIMYIGNSNNNSCENIEEKPLIAVWDENGKSEWTTSTLKTELEKWATDNNLSDSPYIVTDATWYIGGIKFFEGRSLSSDIKDERTSELDEVTTYNGIVGLINVSDYLKANDKPCMNGAYGDKGQCGEDNYLNNDVNFWTINKTYNDAKRVWGVEKSLIEIDNTVVEKTLLQSKYVNNNKFNAYPVVYLKANLVLKGLGTAQNPYYIVQ